MENLQIIQKLKQQIQKDLPGWEAQKRLIPEGRIQDFQSKNLHPAAVLIAIYEDNHEWVFPLIRRSADGFAHSGQIALPGGRRDGSESDIETALREAHEEVNIHPDTVEVIGKTSPLPIPVSNHLVQPVVGFTNTTPDLIPEPKEVAEIFSISLKTLSSETIQYETRRFHDRDWEIPFFAINGHKVWGATAMILSEFKEILSRI